MKLQEKIYRKWAISRDEDFVKVVSGIPIKKNDKVIDLGCGTGVFTKKIQNITGVKSIDGVEAILELVDLAKYNGVNCRQMDLNKNIEINNNSIDIILSNQVIEHLNTPIAFLEEIYRILKPGGTAVISTENLASWDNILFLVLGKNPRSMEWDKSLSKKKNDDELHSLPVTCAPHVRIFSFDHLRNSASSVGFKDIKISGTGHVLFKFGEFIDQRHCRFITLKLKK